MAKNVQVSETTVDALVEGCALSQDQVVWYIDIGKDRGVRKGTKSVISREGDVIKHPIMGEIHGKKATSSVNL